MEIVIAAATTGILDFSIGPATFEPIGKKTQRVHESLPAGLNAMIYAAIGSSLAVLITKREFSVVPVLFAMGGRKCCLVAMLFFREYLASF
jgi:hypothetical protein